MTFRQRRERIRAFISPQILTLLSRKMAGSGGSFCLVRRGSDWVTVGIRTFQEGWVDLDDDTGTQARFAEYTASLASVLGHADRVRPVADYCIGLRSADSRKRV